MQTENKYLHIQGAVSDKLLKQLLKNENYAAQNSVWVFVDYSPVKYKIETKLDVLLAGKNKKMLPEVFDIKLADVIDQTGKHLNAIPLGWKTMCKFEFTPGIPSAVLKLPILSTWTDKSKLKFARHEDIVVDPFNLSIDVYTEVIEDFISM